MEDRSMYRAVVDKKKIWLPESVIKERFQALAGSSQHFAVAKLEPSPSLL